MRLKATHIILAALAGIILFQFLFYKCDHRGMQKQVNSLQEQVNLCVNAPIKVDTVTVRDTLKVPIGLQIGKPTQVGTKVIFIHDTLQVELPVNEYSGVYIHPQFEAHWTAHTTGTLDDLTIQPPSLIKSLIITKEKTVDLTQYQTNLSKEKSHLYTNLGVGFSHGFWGADAGLSYIRKEGWGLSVGISTDLEKMIYKGGIILRLK